MSPQRIQRKRTKGWRMPEGAVYVGRPSKWGNPFKSAEWSAAAEAFEDWLLRDDAPILAVASLADMVSSLDLSRRRDRIIEDLDELRGKDLVCFCELDSFCHADVLLEIANQQQMEAV